MYSILTALIIWTTSAVVVNVCGGADIGGCYVIATDTIYIASDLENRSDYKKDFVLFHEIGHSLYKHDFPKEIFKNGLFAPDYEIIADNFAWWIYAKKYPKERKFVRNLLSQKKLNYFASTCDRMCVCDILSIKIP